MLRASNRQEDINVATKLFVGNLAFSTTQTELEQLFSEVGEIGEVFIPMDRDSGRPRGFAFVEFPDAAIAENLGPVEKLVPLAGPLASPKHAQGQPQERSRTQARLLSRITDQWPASSTQSMTRVSR